MALQNGFRVADWDGCWFSLPIIENKEVMLGLIFTIGGYGCVRNISSTFDILSLSCTWSSGNF